MPSRIATDPLDWLSLSAPNEIPEGDAERQKRTALALLERLYGADAVPGVILADEVGMGKTYVVFAVMAALMRDRPRAKTLVLTHSRQMARIWQKRWATFCARLLDTGIDLKADAVVVADACRIGASRLAFGSFDTIKHLPTTDLKWALERTMKGRHEATRKMLRKDLFGTKSRPRGAKSEAFDRISQKDVNAFLRTFLDDDSGTWRHKWKVKEELRRLVYKASRTRRTVDLLVVDEAHKTASEGRASFFETVMDNRSEKVIYVTATPFALSLSELKDHLVKLHGAAGHDLGRLEGAWGRVEQFAAAVEAGLEVEPALRTAVEQGLGRYLVRSLWPETIDGKTRTRVVKTLRAEWAGSAKTAHARATALLALETGLTRVQRSGVKTHAAAHRETLNSSYAAIKAAARGREDGVQPVDFLSPLADRILRGNGESPKFTRVFDYLVDCALRREKVVVFCRRQATIQELRKRLSRHPKIRKALDADRLAWTRLSGRTKEMGFDPEERRLLRMAVHHGLGSGRARPPALLARIMQRKVAAARTEDNDELCDAAWGLRRRIDWVGTISGTADRARLSAVEVKATEVEQFAFNLPGPPYILLCSKKAREGIDLHKWCRRIVQYDLEWNPAMLEQQIGRVDRIGSLSRRENKSIEVVYAWVPGTYEEHMAGRVQHRQAMMRVLLGAGDRLADTAEEQDRIENLERYRLNFAP